MALTPTDVHNKEFHRKMRGYAEEEVDEFLDEIVREFEALLRERDQMRLKLEEAEQNLTRFRQVEEHLQRALVVAQQTADDLRQNAQKEADLVVREAQQRAEQVLDQGRVQVREVERDLIERRRELEIWKAKVRSLLESELTLLANEPSAPMAQREEA
ncbi:MAG: DivIVA domain-containing protein [Thermaerobacter sp.]|nr:DivIVA domain-containing protein [Thermaerobacter sp.]